VRDGDNILWVKGACAILELDGYTACFRVFHQSSRLIQMMALPFHHLHVCSDWYLDCHDGGEIVINAGILYLWYQQTT
jgi:hypothetical protein